MNIIQLMTVESVGRVSIQYSSIYHVNKILKIYLHDNEI